MSTFIRKLSLFMAGLPLLASRDVASAPGPAAAAQPLLEPEAVPLRPLNFERDNLFAAHRSHSSHSSHRSHSSLDEKRRLQIMRVQIALTSLGIYDGRIDGVLNPETKTALSMFQTLKGLPGNGLMTTQTLNALGVPAAH